MQQPIFLTIILVSAIMLILALLSLSTKQNILTSNTPVSSITSVVPSTLTSNLTTYSTTSPTTIVASSTIYATACHFSNGLPDSSCNPGSINSNATQSNIYATICVSGYTKTIRPPTSYTNPLKIQSIAAYGYNDTNTADYEEDHLISLELGGNPRDPKNLWAEPHYGTFNSYAKDGFENYLHGQVCNGIMTLAQAQTVIATNWVSYWIAAGQP